MSEYVRPVIAAKLCRDADGSVIAYGSRWGIEGPPEDTYSVDSHPERFEPVHRIAEALIEYLQREYDVQIIDDLSCAADVRYNVNARRAVRVAPRSSDAASLTFVFTDYPGLVVHAGLLHDFLYPQCGCDACDENWESVADELERTVLAVVSGGYREEVRGGETDVWVRSRLDRADGCRTSSNRADPTAGIGADLQAASGRLTALPDGWAPWVRRSAGNRT